MTIQSLRVNNNSHNKKMKFELKPNNRNLTNEDLLNDLRRVSSELKKNSISTEEYNKYGRVHVSTIQNRFGTWNRAIKIAGLQIRKHYKYNAEELIKDLKRVAEILGKKSMSRDDYKSYGKYDTRPFTRIFGTWGKAHKYAGLENSRHYRITNEEYFQNLEEIWTKLGRQPNYTEVRKPLSKYSSHGYEKRFGSWRKALEAFVSYMNKESHSITVPAVTDTNPINLQENLPSALHKTNRNINWRLRFIVMKRDNFKCIKCGRSPSTDSSVILHVDHIKPFSKGGETVLENLETLCMICNIGKSDII